MLLTLKLLIRSRSLGRRGHLEMGRLQRWVGFDDLSERGFTLRQVQEQMLVHRLHVSESGDFGHLFHVAVPHF